MEVVIQENQLVLIGENGTGKSTFVNLLYYFLSAQWGRLAQYQFESLEADYGGRSLDLTYNELQEHLTADEHLTGRMARYMPRAVLRNFAPLLSGVSLDQLSQADVVERLSDDLGMPQKVARDLIADYVRHGKERPSKVRALETQLAAALAGKFLYLPTYRRIEQDLRSIFGGGEGDTALKRFREELAKRGRGALYVELMEFGMQDVEQAISKRMSEIKDAVRTGLDGLVGTYLHDVIHGLHTSVDMQSFSQIKPNSLNAVFARIDERTLSMSDKEALKRRVESITTGSGTDEDKVVAHFLQKLTNLHAEQQEAERDVRAFVAVCNRYLSGKQIVYDDVGYQIYVRSDPDSVLPVDSVIEMKALSSGEKQIVSLFSHLFFSGEKKFFVIIDEPEMSLSVPWQRSFLPDILETRMCAGLVAVTHSPFVWENALADHVATLAECTIPFAK
jgi:predicted ATPase